MFCQNCGKELPDNAKFCSGCGAAVEETVAVEETEVFPSEEAVPESDGAQTEVPAEEREDAAPADAAPDAPAPEEKTVICAPVVVPVQSVMPVENELILSGEKKRRGKSLILLAAIAAVLVVLVVGAIKVLPSVFGGKGVYLYMTEDAELMSMKKLKAGADAVELTDEGIQAPRFSKDGKYIYFFEEDEGYSGYGTLYRMETAKLGKKGAEPEKVSSEVQWNIRVLDSGAVVYLKGSGNTAQLRLYNGKDSFKLASDVTGFSLNKKQTYAYFTEEEYDGMFSTSTLYRVELKQDGQKEKLLSEVGQFYGSYTDDMLVYGKYADETGLMDVYVAKPGEKGSKVLDDVANVFNVETSGEKVSFSFSTCQTEEHVLYDFVTDKLASGDANVREPDRYDYGHYSGWGWWETDWDAYNAARETWYEARNRISIREELKKTEYDITTYTLCRYENGTVTKLADGVDTAYVESDAENKVYIYPKSTHKVSKVADVADFDYFSQIYDLIDSGETQWYQNVNGTEKTLDIDSEEYIVDFGVLNGKEAILAVSDGAEAVIRCYKLGKDGMSFTETVTDDEFTGLVLRKNENSKDAMYYFTDLNTDKTAGELIRYVDGKKESVAKDANRVVILKDSAVFKMEDSEYDSRSGAYECTLYTVGNGKNTKIADEVWANEVTFMGAKKVVYISDSDLYVWNGSRSEKIANNVVRFWTNESLSNTEISTFSCNNYNY